MEGIVKGLVLGFYGINNCQYHISKTMMLMLGLSSKSTPIRGNRVDSNSKVTENIFFSILFYSLAVF